MSDKNFASHVSLLIGGTADTFLVCAGAGSVVSQKTASEVVTLISAVPSARTISASTGLSGGGDLSADRTLSLANTAVTAGSYTSANITVDAQGRITAAANGSGGGTPGGSSGQVQFNNAGALGGAAAIVYSSSTPNVTMTPQGTTHVAMCFQGISSQTADFLQWKNSSGTLLAYISKDGEISGGRANGYGTKIGGNGAVGCYCIGTVSGIGFSGQPDVLPTDGSAGLTNGTIALGRSNYRWGSIFGTTFDLSGPVKIGVYTFGTTPSASANTGATIRISDRSHRLATSDGTNWNWAGSTTAIS